MEPRCSSASYVTRMSGIGFEVGDSVWSPCARQGFRRSTITGVDAASDSFFVESQEDQGVASIVPHAVRRSEVRPFYEAVCTYDDNTAMAHLDDANILDNIKRRFFEEKVYTYTANVLLAVNPYRKLPHLYTQERRNEYHTKNTAMLPPHPYAIADTAYRHLIRERRNQALVISGESGAGKTETAKITMHYLTSVSRTDAAHGGRIQDKIINSNPILESFGNASTVRNMNSSRFGKYNEMWFNRVGSLAGAGIKTFLLESSRVVSQQEGERNYHVFYEMLAGLDPETLEQLQLDPSNKYRLLYTANAKTCVEDSQGFSKLQSSFEELRTALATFADEETQRDIWDVCAALIHLGEVEFVETGAVQGEFSGESQEPLVAVAPEGQEALAQAADLLGLSQLRLEQVLKWREMHVKRQTRRTSHINCPRTKSQATATLQSVIKILYKRLFDRIVEMINVSSAGHTAQATERSSYGSIGTLDIYGFERLQTNSFEQLCINLANERLQQFFIEEVLEAEQRTYAEEMLQVCRWPLPDSQPVVQSIQGIMSILDEHSLRSVKNLVGSGEDKDARFCEHVHREKIKGGNGPVTALKLKATRSGAGVALHDGFQIRHYAGDVAYSTRGWIDKNNDALVPEVESLLADGMKELVRNMSDAENIDALSGERLQSVSSNYLANLSQLLATLKNCSVHYIRCFNPNQRRHSGEFDTKYVLDQVIQCGTVELVGIMHHGYPHRCLLQDLRQRFTKLLPEDFSRYSDRDFVLAIMLAFEIDETQWTLGTKRLFLKAGQLRVLENLRDDGCTAAQDIIRKIRMKFARKKVRAWASVMDLMRWWPQYVKEQKRLHLLQGLRKAVHVVLRLHRWLRSARQNLYGLPPEAERPHVEVAMRQHGLTYTVSLRTGPLGSGPLRQQPLRSGPLELPTTGTPQMFVCLNIYELPHYAAYLQNEVNIDNNVDEHVLKVWQKNASESVLFFTGKSLLSVRFSPRPFLRQPGARIPADMMLGDCRRSLEDLRQVDPHETGLALPLSSGGFEGNITCMCQHGSLKHTFATCNNENTVVVWRWMGTETSDFEKPATKPLGVVLWRDPILSMCFLSSVPDRISSRGGLVLAIVSADPSRHWLMVSLVAVYAGGIFHVEGIHVLGVERDAQPNLREEGFEINFFTATQSDRVLVLGGRGLLQFLAIREIPDGPHQGELEFAQVLDVTLAYPDLKNTSMVSCLSLPTPGRHGDMEFVAIGDSKGVLYGMALKLMQGGFIHLDQQSSGRFRTNKHTEGVPIRTLVASYGQEPFSHHKAVQAKGMPYSLFLNTVTPDEKAFYSVGDDGVTLGWRLLPNQGWTAIDETCMRSMSCWEEGPEVGRYIAAHGSRLAPNIVVLAEQERGLLMCFDRTNPHELPVEAMCAYS